MKIDDLVEQLLQIKGTLGNVEVCYGTYLCGDEINYPLNHVEVGLDRHNNKVVELQI